MNIRHFWFAAISSIKADDCLVGYCILKSSNAKIRKRLKHGRVGIKESIFYFITFINANNHGYQVKL